jgi:diguanylate cyclase (GGDEF)-like protein
MERKSETIFLKTLKNIWDELAFVNDDDDAIRLVISAIADIEEFSKQTSEKAGRKPDTTWDTRREILALTACHVAAKGIALKEERLRAVTTENSFQQMHLQLLKKNMELRERTMIDELTGLFNRRYFERSLSYDIERFRRYKRPFGVILFDVDHFKAVNDHYGHSVGDAALKHLAESARKAVRGADMAARYGGEEFALILPETGREGAMILAERLRSQVESSSLTIESGELHITISLGVTAVEGEFAGDAEDVMRLVDNALYAAKDAGRNCLSVV